MSLTYSEIDEIYELAQRQAGRMFEMADALSQGNPVVTVEIYEGLLQAVDELINESSDFEEEEEFF